MLAVDVECSGTYLYSLLSLFAIEGAEDTAAVLAAADTEFAAEETLSLGIEAVSTLSSSSWSLSAA